MKPNCSLFNHATLQASNYAPNLEKKKVANIQLLVNHSSLISDRFMMSSESNSSKAFRHFMPLSQF